MLLLGNPNEEENRCPAGHPGPDGPQDARRAGPAARLRPRPAHRADQRRSAHAQHRHALSVAVEAGAGRGDRVRTRAVREQPQRAFLPADHASGASSCKSETRDWERTTALIGRFFDREGARTCNESAAAVPDPADHVGHQAAGRRAAARGARRSPRAADRRERPGRHAARGGAASGASSRSARAKPSGKIIGTSRACRLLEHLLQDARIARPADETGARRSPRRRSAILALGLGLTSAVASLAYALFLKPLPVDGASQVVFVGPPENARRGFPGPFPTTSTIAITRACSPTWPRTTRRRP